MWQFENEVLAYRECFGYVFYDNPTDLGNRKFGVPAYSQDRLIGEYIQYLVLSILGQFSLVFLR